MQGFFRSSHKCPLKSLVDHMLPRNHVCDCIFESNFNVINTEIHFLPVYESYTHALFIGTKHLRLDSQVCFYRQLFPELSNQKGAFYGLCGPRGALIRLHGVQN